MTTDEQTILDALRAFRRVAQQHEHGGMDRHAKLAQDAIAAFGRMTDPQPELFHSLPKLAIDK